MLVHKIVRLAFQFQVFFSVASTASLPTLALPPASRSSLSAQFNSTLLVNLTLVNSPPNTLPEDPAFYRLNDSNLVIKFSNYGASIDARSTYGALQSAVEDVMMHILPDPQKGDIVMTPRSGGYFYSSGNVRLSLMTQPGMTWGMWGETLGGLRQFAEYWEFVELRFDTIDDGGVTRGSGQLLELQRFIF